MHQQKDIILDIKKHDELDEYVFVEWKNELERNLQNFWEKMGQT
jgi:hypothetical protein